MKSLSEKGILTKFEPDKPIIEQPTNVCTGLGVVDRVPWRVAAYALPTLQLASSAGLSVAEFYWAMQYSVALNSQLSTAQAKQSVALTQEYIKAISAQVQTKAKPIWLEERDAFEPARFLLAALLAYRLSQQADEQILRFADARDGDDSLLYMAAHALYMYDPLNIDPSRFIVERDQTPAKLIMVGGPAEKIFRKARLILLSQYPTDDTRQTAQAYSEIGRMPPYYPAPLDPVIGDDNRPTLDEILTLDDLDVRRDLLYLLVGLSENTSFSDLKRISKGSITQDQRDDLQISIEKLTEVIKQLES